MYTFHPLADVNTINDHIGFYLVAGFTACFWIYMMVTCRDDLEGAGWVTAIMVVFVGIVGLISWTSGEYKVYANTQVEGKFSGFVAEGYNVTEHSGKTTRHVDKHEQYVVYTVEGNQVLFRAELGATYPQTAVLYKN